ncbi:MAG TPA: phage major capsid protein [Pseudomonas sp.]|nr:phage major capsid protein [Pseudomonas sp.]MBB50262.1 phage major capsid protein [Pseudomonadales bacterium]MBB50490.1 phage major capsid protein [Pseudomonadales bacterium]HCA25251.1 phage major capsid protein [Pseudomonas sp.]|tara:strand:+ start:18800 stop:20116 length:1317 start_codon:yes stop_codon:yes gene_type:complete
MSLVLKLRSERAELNTQLQALAKLEAEGTALSAEQLSQFADLEAQINALTEKLGRAEAAERSAAASAVPVDESAQGVTGPPESRVEGPYAPKPAPGAKMAQMVRLLAAAQGNQLQAAQMAKEGGFPADVHMALSTVTAGAGGVLVPENMSSEVIESLRPRSVVRGLGAVSLPLNNGNMTIPRINGNTSVSYLGTETDISLTDMTFDDLKLSAKKAAAIVPISNDLLAFSGANPRVDQMVANDLTISMGLSEDLHFLRADGTGNLPKGLRHWALPGNVVTAPAGVTLSDLDLFLGGLMLRLEAANANMESCGWVMAPRTIRWLGSLRDGNGNKAYPEIEMGMLKGYPFRLTTQIPTNLGAGSNESEIYFADFADCYIGEEQGLIISFSQEASYKDGAGEWVSAFQRDQTLVRVIAKHDFGPRHVESVAVGVGITWGAGM